MYFLKQIILTFLSKTLRTHEKSNRSVKTSIQTIRHRFKESATLVRQRDAKIYVKSKIYVKETILYFLSVHINPSHSQLKY